MRFLWGLLLLLALLSCKSNPPRDGSDVERYVAQSDGGEGRVACKAMLDGYCSELYSPKALGNLLIDRKKPILILQGETQNQHSQVFWKNSLAKIRNQKKYPADFLEILNQYSYFQKLESFIYRPPIPSMTLEERMNTENLNYELSSIWQSAIDQTILKRMSINHRGYHRIPEKMVPVEYDIEERRIRRKLISEISKATWRDDANWKKVVEGFNDLKSSFLSLFEKLEIPNDVRDDWKSKIVNLELVLPGSLPEISDEECSSTKNNAYYYRYLNMITVCAGDFNSQDILFTLAHEMSHSLDLSRDIYKRMRDSALGVMLANLREMSCTKPAEFSCEKWASFKKDAPDLISQVLRYKPQLYEFQRCLKKNVNTKSITQSDYDRISGKIVASRVANLASQDVFLRLVKEKLPLRNGHLQTNPNFMNPCQYYLWSRNQEPVDDELYTLIFFVSEFKCDQGPEADRMKRAIEVAKLLSEKIVNGALQLEGEFSDRTELTSEGFAYPPFERFADVVGSYAVAEFLQNMKSKWEQRSKFLASASWLCDEPSLESRFPEESKIEQLYTFESHSEGEDRRMELLSAPIRKVLSCEKDFEFKECSLPFKR